MAESTSGPDWPSLPGPSSVEDNRSLQGSNSTATKRFSSNRVELQELKSQQKAKEHLRRSSAFASLGSADNTDYVLQQSHNSDVTYTGLTEPKMPVRSSQPSLNSSPEKRTGDLGNTPRSQWESLERISPLQIHHTLDLANKAKNEVLSTEAKSEPPLDTGASPLVGSPFNWAPPPGVSPLCVHFLQDNRKGQPFRHPKPCSNCTKRSKLLYGIWRSDTKEWQVMRPYPKAVNSNVHFQLCWHFSNGIKCQKSPCTFAHGSEELMFWTSERQSGRLQSCPEVDTQNVIAECLFVCLFVFLFSVVR